ncbi:MAG: hypothetical protein EOQ42_27625 [Mesorhizobium sp.]|uniref:hypothetical protein n=1 Tax=Mesorhizobium sp. TaxID=1871066 RepID=UPI000FEAB2C5|nr:hypothetical protein [Mesorhizobium sp.]RWB31642.1 MAG: hypothetical protein EOQ43_10765 [Mesorhizobium sp.]RWB50350.1 MAG: hypothetical protein EOQ42_27625 [Mesorhizobium sp.]RWD02297.1 MAG: hypothetical protein EOS57_26790 [Mesorhizobium sp.]
MGDCSLGVGVTDAGTDEDLFLPLDVDRHSERLVFVHATDSDLAKRLRLSALDFALSDLRLMPLADFVSDWPAPRTATLAYLFHLPFAGSSLLATCLERVGLRVLRDPAILDALFQGDRAQGPASFDAHTAERQATLGALAELARGRPAVIRCAGYHPAMVERLVAAPGFHRAMFLFCDWRDFVCQVLKDDKRQNDMLRLADIRGAMITGTRPVEAAEAAAWFWLDSCRNVCRLIEGGHTVAGVDAGRLFADPPAVAMKIATLLGVETAERGDAGGTWDAIRLRHAKTGAPYDEPRRRSDLAQAQSCFADTLAALAPRMAAEGSADIRTRLRSVELT